MNRLFGYQNIARDGGSSEIAFDGMQCVAAEDGLSRDKPQFRIFASPDTHLLSSYSRQHNATCYVWGNPVHDVIAASDIPAWCIEVIVGQKQKRFRELIGTFIVIVDEPERNRITFVNDVLGISPMFVGIYDGRLVFGSDVWPMYEAGLSDGAIDYDALSAWIAYGYNCTDGSLFSDLRRLAPGALTVYEDGQYKTIPYAEFEGGSQTKSVDQAAEELHHIVSSTAKTLLANQSRVSIALSGGFDSRYLAALALSIKGRDSLECMTVSFTKAEGEVAREVGERLGLKLESLPVNGSLWDLYDQVYHDTPDGFPISKFVTHCVAQRYPGIPMVNGFLGGSTVGGEEDTINGRCEDEFADDLADILQEDYFSTWFRAFHRDVAKRIRLRSRVPMEDAVRKGSKTGRIFARADYYYRQRLYISNNVLQHRDISEALLPFYSWTLLSYAMAHNRKVLSREVYCRIFRNHFPQLAVIPLASDLPGNKRNCRASRHTRRWALQMLPLMFSRSRLSLVSRTWGIPVDMAGIMGLYRVEGAIFLLERLCLLEKKVRDGGLQIDWGAI